jgi:hypothetical protein
LIIAGKMAKKSGVSSIYLDLFYWQCLSF